MIKGKILSEIITEIIISCIIKLITSDDYIIIISTIALTKLCETYALETISKYLKLIDLAIKNIT